MTGSLNTPGAIARLDQDLAPAYARLDRILQVTRRQITEDGPGQAFANLALAMTMLSEDATTDYLLVTIWRLAGQHETGEPRS